MAAAGFGIRHAATPRVRVGFAPLRLVHELDGESMGTGWRVVLVAGRDFTPAPVREAIEAALARVDTRMSHWNPASDLSRFNRSGRNDWVDLPGDLCRVLDCALRLADDTDGAFDPTIGALVALWGFGPQGNGPRRALPSPDELAQARGRGGWRRLGFDRAGQRARQPGGIALDFSGIAKGYAVDRVADALADFGFGDFLVEVGGELRARGRRADGRPWQVAVATPGSLRAARPPILALGDRAVATSGDQWHAWTLGGRRYSHTIDPRTAWPVPDTLAAVTVVHEECMRADALATALAVLGVDEGLAFAHRHGLCAAFALRAPGEGAGGGTTGGERAGDGAGEILRTTPGFDTLLQ